MSSVTEASTSALGKQGEMLSGHPTDSCVPSKYSAQRIRVRETIVSLTRLGGYSGQSFGSFGQELFAKEKFESHRLVTRITEEKSNWR